MGLQQHPLLRVFGVALLALSASALFLFWVGYLLADTRVSPLYTAQAFQKFWHGLIHGFWRTPALMAAWVALAGALLVLYGLWRGVFLRQAVIATLVLPWLLMDWLWQRELGAHLDSLRDAFGGRTVHERHLADEAGALYLFTTRARAYLSQPGDVRVFIGFDKPAYAQRATRAAYYLLPHSVYVAGLEIPWSQLHKGDVLLWLGSSANGLGASVRCGAVRCQTNALLPPVLLDDVQGQHPVYAQLVVLVPALNTAQEGGHE